MWASVPHRALDRPIAVEAALSQRLASLEARARAVVESHIAPRERDESDEGARAMTRALGDAGLLEPGVELDVPGVSVIREVVANVSGLADSMVALQGLGYAPIALAGSTAARARWLDPVRSGRAIAALAITEPEAGSDIGATQTTAARDGPDYVLRGVKCFITNAGLADFYVTLVRTGEPGPKGLSLIWVPASAVRLVSRYELLAAHPCGEIAFDEVRVPAENLVGAPGEGYRLATGTLERFRVTVGAAAVGMASRALREATLRASARQRFNKPIGQFQQVGAMLADSWAELMASRLLVYRAAQAHAEEGEEAGALSSAAKMFATECAQRIIDRAVQIHGGEGVRRGSAVERLYREIRALRIYEGTTEIQRVILSRHLLGK